MKSIIQDVGYSLRMFRRNRKFTIVAVLTFALGIGVNAALFTVFDAFVLKPLPLKDPDRLVNFESADSEGRQQRLFSYRNYLDYRDQNQVFTDLIAWNKLRVTLGEAAPHSDDSSAFAEGYEYLFGQIVSGNYFHTLGAEMQLGRAFDPSDDERPGERPVLVLSHSCWQRRFNSNPGIIGKTIFLQGQAFTVVGVTAPEFIGTTPDVPSFWAPLMMRDQLIQAGGWGHKEWLTDRSVQVLTLLGRLKPGLTARNAVGPIQLIADRLAEANPGPKRQRRITLERAGTFVTLNEDVMQLVLPLLVGFALVLLIACANVANLLLARAAGRQREIGVRLAIGASPRRLTQQLVTESVLLGLGGGLVGLLFAMWTLKALYSVVLSSIPLPDDLTSSFALNLAPDWRIFGFTLLIASAAGIVAGLAPALRVSKLDLTTAIKEEGWAIGGYLSKTRLRSVLVVAQVGICLTLLLCAGLLIKNLHKIETFDTGMATKKVFSVAVGLSGSPEKDPVREAALREQLETRLRALTGVSAVSAAYRQPLSGEMSNTLITLAGQPSDHPNEVRFNFVSADYFDTLSIPLVRGRSFSSQEIRTNTHVVVISEATAARFWPNADPLGKLVGIAADAGSQREASEDQKPQTRSYKQYEVIGVARDARSRWLWEKDETFFYVPLPSSSSSGQYVLVRTQNDPASVMSSVRGVAAEIDPSLRTSVRRIEENLAYQAAPFRAIAWLSSLLGLLALCLASVGLYGVMSFVVERQTREIGIRIALGAKPGDVVRLFLFQGLRLAVTGMVLGLAGGVLIARLLAAVLIGVSSVDPMAFFIVLVFLTVIAIVAILVPARRATRVDPMVALRYE